MLDPQTVEEINDALRTETERTVNQSVAVFIASMSGGKYRYTEDTVKSLFQLHKALIEKFEHTEDTTIGDGVDYALTLTDEFDDEEILLFLLTIDRLMEAQEIFGGVPDMSSAYEEVILNNGEPTLPF